MSAKYGFKYRCRCKSCNSHYITDRVEFTFYQEALPGGGYKLSSEYVAASRGCPHCGSKKVSSAEEVS